MHIAKHTKRTNKEYKNSLSCNNSTNSFPHVQMDRRSEYVISPRWLVYQTTESLGQTQLHMITTKNKKTNTRKNTGTTSLNFPWPCKRFPSRQSFMPVHQYIYCFRAAFHSASSTALSTTRANSFSCKSCLKQILNQFPLHLYRVRHVRARNIQPQFWNLKLKQ